MTVPRSGIMTGRMIVAVMRRVRRIVPMARLMGLRWDR